MAAHTKSKEYKKEIWLFTDGEYGADWGTNLDGCIDRYTELKVSLHFVSVLCSSVVLCADAFAQRFTFRD